MKNCILRRKSYILRIAIRFFLGIPNSIFSSFISWVSVFAVGTSVAIITVVLGVINGFEKEITKHTIAVGGHAIFFFNKSTTNDWIPSFQILKDSEEVESVIPFLRGEALISYGDKTFPVNLEGFRFSDKETKPLNQYSNHSDFEQLLHSNNEVLLGSVLASRLNVKAGEQLMILVPRWSKTDDFMNISSSSITMRDTFSVGLHDVDSQMIITKLEIAQRILNPQFPVTGFRAIYNNPSHSLQKTRKLLSTLGDNFEGLDWTQYNRNFFLALKSQKRILFVILSLIIAVATFNIAATVLLIVKERKAEILILHTIGCGPLSITSVFLLIALIVASIGAILGVIMGYLLGLCLNPFINLIESVFQVTMLDPTIYYIDHLPIEIQPTDLGLTISITIVLCLLSCMVPAYRASRHPLSGLD